MLCERYKHHAPRLLVEPKRGPSASGHRRTRSLSFKHGPFAAKGPLQKARSLELPADGTLPALPKPLSPSRPKLPSQAASETDSVGGSDVEVSSDVESPRIMSRPPWQPLQPEGRPWHSADLDSGIGLNLQLGSRPGLNPVTSDHGNEVVAEAARPSSSGGGARKRRSILLTFNLGRNQKHSSPDSSITLAQRSKSAWSLWPTRSPSQQSLAAGNSSSSPFAKFGPPAGSPGLTKKLTPDHFIAAVRTRTC